MRYERHHQPLLPKSKYWLRLVYHSGVALLIMGISLGMGMAGYHYLEGLPWLDALLNASMILGGMGPITMLHTPGGKLFASFYALYAGVIFLVVIGVLFAPVFHRFLHHFHLDEEN